MTSFIKIKEEPNFGDVPSKYGWIKEEDCYNGPPDVNIKVECQNENIPMIDDGHSSVDNNGFNGRSRTPSFSDSIRVHPKPSPTQSLVCVIDDILSSLEMFGGSNVKSPLMDSSLQVFSFSNKDKDGKMSADYTGHDDIEGEGMRSSNSKLINEIKESSREEKSSRIKATLFSNILDKATPLKSNNESADIKTPFNVKKEDGASEKGHHPVKSNEAHTTKKCKFCDKQVNLKTLNKHQRCCRDGKTGSSTKTLKVRVTIKEIDGNLRFHETKTEKSISLRNEKRNNQMKETLPYECKVCGKVFKKLSALTVHVRTHTGDKPFTCKYCGKRLSRPESLERHERLHTKERPFKCGYCDKTFNGAQDVKKHERTHTGERPYKCKYCDKAFKDLGTLGPHEKIHTGEKPYQCKYCEKAFIRGCYLRRHERIHTGEKPYTCKQCGRAFSRTYTLRCHERKIHNM